MNRKLKNSELQRLTPQAYAASEKLPVVVVLDNVRSLYNVGAVFRTSDAFLVQSVYLCGVTATPPHREIRKTALGAEEWVQWQHFGSIEDAMLELRARGYRIIALEQTENSIGLEGLKLKKGDRLALVFGHEVSGVSQIALDMAEACIELPQFGAKHSFNIAVAVGIVLWEVSQKIRLHK